MIYIISGDINTGKTKKAFEFFKKHKNKKKILSFISKKEIKKNKRIYFLYVNNIKISKLVEVYNTKIVYYQYIFDKIFYLVKKLTNNIDFFIIDEIGPIEIFRKDGYFKVLNYLIKKNKKVVICVRKSLIDDFIKSFKIKRYIVLNRYLKWN